MKTGAIRLAVVVNRIIQNPACWDQSTWHCGTAHCVAGHGQLDSGKAADTDTAFEDAEEWFELSYGDAAWLFNSDRSLAEIREFAARYLSGDAYYRNGYDCNGFGRDGFDRRGRDRDGLDRRGLDRDGRDRDGKKLPLLEIPENTSETPRNE